MRLDSSVADRITGFVLLALGISMLAGGFMMDRLEIRQIHPASIPGLLPMGLGAAMACCAVLLILSTRQDAHFNPRGSTVDELKPDGPGSYKNLLITALLSVAYAAGLVGNIPFYAATALFIFSFSLYFLWPGSSADTKAKLRIIFFCAIYAVVFAVGISVLFRYGFLVRLP